MVDFVGFNALVRMRDLVGGVRPECSHGISKFAKPSTVVTRGDTSNSATISSIADAITRWGTAADARLLP